VEQELLTLLELLSTSLVFSEVLVTQSLVFCVVFGGPLFVFNLLSNVFLLSFNLQTLIAPLLSSNFSLLLATQ